MFNIVLFEPEIPPNTGNIIRLCANTGMDLHLIEPLGFTLDDKQLRRAGLDYHELAQVQVHASLDAFLTKAKPPRLFAFSTKGVKNYCEIEYRPADAFLFGPESRGLPETVFALTRRQNQLRIPMLSASRSLNLSNAVAVVVYEAWRQQGFAGIG